MTTPTDLTPEKIEELRKLAETVHAASEAMDTSREAVHAWRDYVTASQPDVVLSLLDHIAALEQQRDEPVPISKIADAAMEKVKQQVAELARENKEGWDAAAAWELDCVGLQGDVKRLDDELVKVARDRDDLAEQNRELETKSLAESLIVNAATKLRKQYIGTKTMGRFHEELFRAVDALAAGKGWKL